MSALRAPALVLAVLAFAGAAAAHPLAPVLLDLREDGDGLTSLLWKTPLAQPAGANIEPVLPADCEAVATPETVEEAGARVQRATLRCSGNWVGRTLRVSGLDASGTNALVRVSLADGRTFRALLSGIRAEVVVPEAPSRLDVLRDYLGLGVEHLLTGFDHLLFVLALVLLVRGGRRLVGTVTAFTAGHSVTLAAAALGVVSVPQGPVEVLIASSLVVLAAEIDNPRPTVLARRPGLVAGGFGLVHGLGFAGALAAAGLPAGEIPLALFAFNVGIEAGQLVVIAVVLVAARAARRANAAWRPPGRALAAYAIGVAAARWVLERVAALAFP